MKWDLEERAEQAFAAYLKQQVSGDMRVYVAWESATDAMQYPCAVVHTATSGPVVEDATWHDARVLGVEVAVMVEAAGTDLTTARERNAAHRSEVMDALAVSDLNAQIAAQGVADIAFSQAQLGECERAVEDRVLITTLRVAVIAEPVEGS